MPGLLKFSTKQVLDRRPLFKHTINTRAQHPSCLAAKAIITLRKVFENGKTI